MFAKRQLNILNARRRLLALEADLNRGLIEVECKNLRSRFDLLASVRNQLAAHRSWLAVGGVVTGAMAAWRWRRLVRLIPAIMAAWRSFKGLRTT